MHIPVDAQAHLDLNALEHELDGEAGERTALVSTMLANNEVGTVEPVEELVRIAHKHGVPIHVDAVQAAGRFRFVSAIGTWMLYPFPATSSARPKAWARCWYVAAHPSNQCFPAVGRSVACAQAHRTLPVQWRSPSGSMSRMRACRRIIANWLLPRHAHRRVRRVAPRADLTGDPERRLPGHASFIFPGVTGEALLVDLDARGIAASSGSACAIGRHEIPATLLAMGLEPSIAKSALRMTFRKPLTREQVERISLAIEESYTDLTRH